MIPLLILIFVFTLVNLFFPVLRLSHWMANNLALMILFSTPLFLFWRSFSLPSWWSKALVMIGLLPIILFCLLFQVFAGMQLYGYRDGIDMSFRPTETLAVNNSTIVVYSQNLFATTSLGVIVRQERRLLPGVLLVREIYRETPYLSRFDHLESVGSNNVRLVMSKQAEGELIIPVRQFVWF